MTGIIHLYKILHVIAKTLPLIFSQLYRVWFFFISLGINTEQGKHTKEINLESFFKKNLSFSMFLMFFEKLLKTEGIPTRNCFFFFLFVLRDRKIIPVNISLQVKIPAIKTL